MQIGSLREGGPHEIETFCEVTEDWRSSRFEVALCAVVYGDRDQPTHSVRLFKAKEE
jgi:hypothetical protein